MAPLKWFQVKNLKEVGMIDIELENAKNQRRSMHRMIGLTHTDRQLMLLNDLTQQCSAWRMIRWRTL